MRVVFTAKGRVISLGTVRMLHKVKETTELNMMILVIDMEGRIATTEMTTEGKINTRRDNTDTMSVSVIVIEIGTMIVITIVIEAEAVLAVDRGINNATEIATVRENVIVSKLETETEIATIMNVAIGLVHEIRTMVGLPESISGTTTEDLSMSIVDLIVTTLPTVMTMGTLVRLAVDTNTLRGIMVGREAASAREREDTKLQTETTDAEAVIVDKTTEEVPGCWVRWQRVESILRRGDSRKEVAVTAAIQGNVRKEDTPHGLRIDDD